MQLLILSLIQKVLKVINVFSQKNNKGDNLAKSITQIINKCV